jgi:hypothetical protein
VRVMTSQHPWNGAKEYTEVKPRRSASDEPQIQPLAFGIRQSAATHGLPESGKARPER